MQRVRNAKDICYVVAGFLPDSRWGCPKINGGSGGLPGQRPCWMRGSGSWKVCQTACGSVWWVWCGNVLRPW